MGMIQGSRSLGLADEPFLGFRIEAKLRREKLQRNRALELCIFSL